MKASLLASCLNDILTRKSLSVHDMRIVVDNAVLPTKDLVAQALESIVLLEDDHHPLNAIDQLGLSCVCVLDESGDCTFTNSEDDDNDGFEPATPVSQFSPDLGSSRWTPMFIPEKTALVCPVRGPSSLKDAYTSRKRDIVHEVVPTTLCSAQKDSWQSNKKENLTLLLLDRAIEFAGRDLRGSSERVMNKLNTRNRQESITELLDQAVAFASKGLKEDQ
jgi:hypothetical protein